jgi:progressive ankylosis protein
MRQRDVFWFWLPLFASWLLMAGEGPIITAAINRLPEQVIMLAAIGIVLSLSVTIESPIINLLATATALVRDGASYRLLRRFTIHWMIGLTAVTLLFSFTPLFDLIVIRLMDVPEVVAEWVRPGMRIMSLWSAAIAWRRFLQGVLIRFGQTRKVAWGTLIRLLSSGGTVIVLALVTDWPGVITGSTALMAGVIAEAAYATIAVRPLLRERLTVSMDAGAAEGTPEELTYTYLFWFHLPLAGTSVMILLVQPLVAFSLARLENPVESLAAWPLVFQVMLMARATAFALPEVVIALTNGPVEFRAIRRFSFYLALLNTIAMALFTLTPLARVYLLQVQNATPLVAELARQGLQLFLLLPALSTLISWLRGLLISRRATRIVNAGMAVNFVVTGAILFAGVRLRLPGIETAAVALVGASLVEMVYLWWRSRRSFDFGVPILELKRVWLQ